MKQSLTLPHSRKHEMVFPRAGDFSIISHRIAPAQYQHLYFAGSARVPPHGCDEAAHGYSGHLHGTRSLSTFRYDYFFLEAIYIRQAPPDFTPRGGMGFTHRRLDCFDAHDDDRCATSHISGGLSSQFTISWPCRAYLAIHRAQKAHWPPRTSFTAFQQSRS